MRYLPLAGTLLALLTLPGTTTFAAPRASDQVQLTLEGTIIVDAPCIINGGNPISVTIDEMLNADVDGVRGAETLGSIFDCTPALTTGLKYRITSTATVPGWDGDVLATSDPNLGIQFYNGSVAPGNAVAVDADHNFQSTNPPVLWVAPVKNPARLPAGGGYSAQAVLTVEYQ